MSYTTIVSTDELARSLGDADLVVVDVRSDLGDPTAGRRAYDAGHVPGAVFADLNRDLASEPGGGRGRHPLPDVASFAERAGAWGIGPGVQVVAYDAGDGMYASRLWWLLRWLGHDEVAVLDGGFAKWVSEGRDVTTDVPTPAPRAFEPRPRDGWIVDAAGVEAMREDASRVLVDSRAPERYRGEVEPIDPVAGHVPGAVNRFYKANVNADGTMRSPDELLREFESTLAGKPSSSAVIYCGSGVTACQNLLALEHAGLPGARLYPGSWSEWVSDPSRPVATEGDRGSNRTGSGSDRLDPER